MLSKVISKAKIHSLYRQGKEYRSGVKRRSKSESMRSWKKADSGNKRCSSGENSCRRSQYHRSQHEGFLGNWVSIVSNRLETSMSMGTKELGYQHVIGTFKEDLQYNNGVGNVRELKNQ